MAVSVVSFQESAWTNITTPKTLTALAWSSGDVVVVVGGLEAGTSSLGTPTNANLTFSLETSYTAGGAGDSAVYIWKATAGSAQTGQTISCTRTGGSLHWGCAVWVLTGTSGSVANASAAAGTPTAGITFTPTAGSGVCYFFGDWNAAVSDQTLSTGTGTGTERADNAGANWGWYLGEWVDVTAGSTTFGVTSYTGLRVAHAVIEILAGTAAAVGDGSPLVMGLPGRIGPDGRVFIPVQRFDNNGAGIAEVTGTVAEIQDNQTSTATGTLGYEGTVAETQDNQTSTASGQLGYSGTVAETQDDQTSTASGTVAGIGEVSGSLAETQDNQTSTASGILGYSGTSARTQADQTSTATGTSTPPPITGTSARTQANQTSTATGILGYTGTSARTQANQTSTASGVVAAGITGTVAETQDNQTSTAAGTVTSNITGSAACTQAHQTSTATGTVPIPGEAVARFEPPLHDGNPMSTSYRNPGNKIMRHYGPWAQGITVWKDQAGVWHESLLPYQGGATHAQHNNWVGGVGPISTYSAPDEGLATAERVYLGGHVHLINEEEEAELIAAGYAANITPLP